MSLSTVFIKAHVGFYNLIKVAVFTFHCTLDRDHDPVTMPTCMLPCVIMVTLFKLSCMTAS